MNRRRFLTLGTLAAGMAPGPFSKLMLAEPTKPGSEARLSKLKLPMLKHSMSTPQIGFPTITPQFAAQFGPGTGGIQMVRTESLDDFYAQMQSQAVNGNVLTAMTTIQNLNRLWYYGAYTAGANANSFQLIDSTDLNAFQQSFAQYQNGYTLVDFTVSWQRGMLNYTGYWMPCAQPANQTMVWNLESDDLGNEISSMASQGMAMTRVQAYQQDAGTLFAALFAPSTASSAHDHQPAATFFSDVTTKFTNNSLAGMAFAPTSGYMFGCYLNPVTPSQFVFDQTWEALTATAQANAANGMILTSLASYPNAPDFDDFFQANEAPFVEGYAYAVSLNGNVISNGGGYARSAAQTNNANAPFTPDSRINIASSSKVVTGVALQVLIQQNPSISLKSPFWPLIQNKVPNPDPSIKTVTLRQLADMKSGLQKYAGDGPLDPPAGQDIWAFLNNYLSQPLGGIPGTTSNYNNTNFTILQAVINQVTGMSYVNWVTQNVLEPAGINPAIYNATSDPQISATLGYSNSSDTRAGFYVGEQTFVAAAGWITSAREMIKLLMALRGTTLLPQAIINDTLTGLLGWDGVWIGNFGTYYYKNGGIANAASPLQWVGSATVRLSEGYDCVLVANSAQPTAPGTTGQLNIIDQVIHAFESRAIPLASEPAGAPSITTVVQQASLLPNCAPGAYAAIIGTGFPGPAVSWDPTTTLPTELNGVQVQIGSEYAYVSYAGPTQINVLLPSTVPTGIQNVQVTMPAGGLQSSVQVNPIAPGLCAYTLNGKSYPVAVFAGTTINVAAAGVLSTPSRPAVAGDLVDLYGTGMGPTNPAAPDGINFSQTYPATNLAAFAVTVGGKAAVVNSAGLVSPGIFEINIVIPSGISGGDQPVTFSVNGIAAQSNLMLTLAQ